MFKKKSIEDVNLKNKSILLRCDFNVPIKNGKIENTFRIDKSLETIKYCLEKECKKIRIVSHLGRPNGKYNKDLSLLPISEYLSSKLNIKIPLVELNKLLINNKKVILVENIRFSYSELDIINNTNLVTILKSGIDIYINDAFGCCHRNQTSIVSINVPLKVSGFLLKKEIEFLSNRINSCEKPFTAIVGGSKVSDKIKLLKNLMQKIDHLIIGGGMAFTFLKKKNNIKIGNSLFDKEGYDMIDDIYDFAEKNNVKIYLPIDIIIADNFSNDANFKTIENDIPDGWMGLDIGKKSINYFGEIIKKSKTILWNGPMGVFEFENFKYGSIGIAEHIKNATKNNALTIVGGGDTSSCVINFGYYDFVTHVSTGGGASLELLEGKLLPGIDVLSDL